MFRLQGLFRVWGCKKASHSECLNLSEPSCADFHVRLGEDTVALFSQYPGMPLRLNEAFGLYVRAQLPAVFCCVLGQPDLPHDSFGRVTPKLTLRVQGPGSLDN